jgi:hypothetical protein
MHWITLTKINVDDHGLPRQVPVLVNLDNTHLIYNEEVGGYTQVGPITVLESVDEIRVKISELK